MSVDLLDLPLTDLVRLQLEERASALDIAEACLARIAEREPVVQAWAFLDPDYARGQARRRDEERRRAGVPLGPLHGVPVGVKDIVDTRDMPTESGTVLHAGRRPTRDAVVVERLRAAGAVILGKTVTTELAVYAAGKTRNPQDPTRSPGGSSSGSAAAVADRMVPVAVGSQTNGSVIRPAAYCGCFGFKPSFGLIPRAGILAQSSWLDHVGTFARRIEDLALLTESLIGFDARDPDTCPAAAPALLATARQDPPVSPRLAFVKGPTWEMAVPDLRQAFARLAVTAGECVSEVALPEGFEVAHETHRTIMEADIAVSFAPLWERGRERLSDRLREMIASGQRRLAVDYVLALARVEPLYRTLEPLLARFGAILTPATTGEAPLLSENHTGSPTFCTIWTLLGMPAVSLPLLTGAEGLPIGVQLVGARGDDARLLRTARWLVSQGATWLEV
jgi:Asp-tRNA(Asn)/Glu-tRNA(Gln) amidotransferase A subunit family amidase